MKNLLSATVGILLLVSSNSYCQIGIPEIFKSFDLFSMEEDKKDLMNDFFIDNSVELYSYSQISDLEFLFVYSHSKLDKMDAIYNLTINLEKSNLDRITIFLPLQIMDEAKSYCKSHGKESNVNPVELEDGEIITQIKSYLIDGYICCFCKLKKGSLEYAEQIIVKRA